MRAELFDQDDLLNVLSVYGMGLISDTWIHSNISSSYSAQCLFRSYFIMICYFKHG